MLRGLHRITVLSPIPIGAQMSDFSEKSDIRNGLQINSAQQLAAVLRPLIGLRLQLALAHEHRPQHLSPLLNVTHP